MSEADPNVQVKSESDKALGKRKAEPAAEDTDDGECMEVDGTSDGPNTVMPDTRDGEEDDEQDEDCQITGRSGSLALSDVHAAASNRHSQAHGGCFHAHWPAMLLDSFRTRARTAPRRSGRAASSRPTPSSAPTASASSATAPRASARSGRRTLRPHTRRRCGETCGRRPRLLLRRLSLIHI